MHEKFSPDARITIIGAGVVGLAVAARLSSSNTGVYLIERNPKFGMETSSRNSEVIHSGIYYPEKSLKTGLCIRGNEMMYRYCEEKEIPYKRLGKLVVSINNRQDDLLKELYLQAEKNGVKSKQWLTGQEVKAMEPEIYCTSAVFFPDTGIVDSHHFMKQLETDAINNGAGLAYNTEVVSIRKNTDCYTLILKDAQGEFEFTTESLINAAGLQSDEIARFTGSLAEDESLHYWKGEYFAMGNGKNHRINHLIYPVPDHSSAGVGIHVTLDLQHGAKLGPNAIYLPEKKYDLHVDSSHLEDFFHSAVQFLPFLEPRDLHPDQAGIRPKLSGPGGKFRDFIIRKESEKNQPSLINLIGIESPGLTSSLAIAEYVETLLNN